ncbi:uncharacterized protein LOC143484334 isoform X2 [Brachyhypopomus gauderio]|uniref:uncharacterized protein LOC143484334 isoform X2 n=1 Tax=Brachyhypopomus gauderio TaxID=698409 RepID=UPI004041D557
MSSTSFISHDNNQHGIPFKTRKAKKTFAVCRLVAVRLAENVNVANVRSVTRVLDAWGKRIFNEVKALLHSQPSSLLPDYSRVRPLSESLNDLFREVSHLQRRITDLNNRLATLEPFLHRHGYHKAGQQGGKGKELVPQSARGAGTSLAKYPRRYRVRVLRPVGRSVQSRKMRTHKDEKGRVIVGMKEKGKQRGEEREDEKI